MLLAGHVAGAGDGELDRLVGGCVLDEPGLHAGIFRDGLEGGSRAGSEGHAFGHEHGNVVGGQSFFGLEGGFSGAIGDVIGELKEGVFFAVVRLDGEVERIVAFGAVGVELDGGGQAVGALAAYAVDGGIGGQDDLEGAGAPLGGGRGAGVVDEVALGDF